MNILVDRTDFGRMLSRVFLVLIPSMVFLAVVLMKPAFAQESTDQWTKPLVIAETDGRLTPGAMAGDSQGNLHVLLTHTPEVTLPIGIDYINWNGIEWSTPVNVLMTPGGGDALLPQLIIDRMDVMHLTWQGGSNLFYATAPVAEAGLARSWSSPTIIGQAILTPMGMVAGPRDDLYVAYSDSREPGRVSLITSTDGGESWSEPYAVAQTPPDTVPGDVQLAMDDSGRLHATWTVYSLAEGNAALGIYYSHRMGTDVAEWRTPFQVAEQRHGQAGIVTVGENEVHLVWRSNIGGDGTFHQWSNDGGKTWFNPDRFDDRGGFSGLAHLVVDNLGRVHYTIGPAYYTMWSEGQLEPYLDVATEEVRATATVSMGEGAILSITRGNRLHIIFHTDFDHIWYTSRLLPVPEASTPTVAATQPEGESDQPTQPASTTTVLEPSNEPTPTPRIMPPVINNSPKPQSSTSSLILLGIAPAVLLVASVLIFNLAKRRR